MSVTDYITKVKEICDALGSINVTVDEDEMVQICLEGLTQRYGPIQMAICTREKPPSFINHANGSQTTQSDIRMLHTEAERPRGHGG